MTECFCSTCERWFLSREPDEDPCPVCAEALEILRLRLQEFLAAQR